MIPDELSHVPLNIEETRLLFQAITDCYERRSLIVTTNIKFEKRGIILVTTVLLLQ